jgi:hypothetical protein
MADGILNRLMTETWPAKLAKSALEALMAPGDAYQGKFGAGGNRDTTANMVGPSADLAGLLVGTPGGSGGLGSGMRRATDAVQVGPLSFPERMALGKEIAMERYNRGQGSGAAYGYASDRAPDARKGTFDRLVQETRAKWDADKAKALDAYRDAVTPPQSRVLLAPGETLDDLVF